MKIKLCDIKWLWSLHITKKSQAKKRMRLKVYRRISALITSWKRVKFKGLPGISDS